MTASAFRLPVRTHRSKTQLEALYWSKCVTALTCNTMTWVCQSTCVAGLLPQTLTSTPSRLLWTRSPISWIHGQAVELSQVSITTEVTTNFAHIPLGKVLPPDEVDARQVAGRLQLQWYLYTTALRKAGRYLSPFCGGGLNALFLTKSK